MIFSFEVFAVKDRRPEKKLLRGAKRDYFLLLELEPLLRLPPELDPELDPDPELPLRLPLEPLEEPPLSLSLLRLLELPEEPELPELEPPEEPERPELLSLSPLRLPPELPEEREPPERLEPPSLPPSVNLTSRSSGTETEPP